MNTVCIIGNIEGEVQLRETPTGKQVANFILHRITRDGHVEASIPVETWGSTAEFVVQKSKRGNKIAVEGRLSLRDGETFIMANSVEFLDLAMIPMLGPIGA